MEHLPQQWLEPEQLEARWINLGRGKLDNPYSSDRLIGARESKIDDGWVMCEIYELVDGRRVVAEVRIYPTPPGWYLEPDYKPVATHVRMFGERAYKDDVVPRGGVTARLMQRARLGHRHAEDVIVDYRKTLKERFGDKAAERFDATLGEVPRRRGGPALPDIYYADIAVQYEMCCNSGSRSPIKDLTEALKVSDAKIRSDIRRARQKGFLEPATMMGAAGGEATEKAHQLVEANTEKGAK